MYDLILRKKEAVPVIEWYNLFRREDEVMYRIKHEVRKRERRYHDRMDEALRSGDLQFGKYGYYKWLPPQYNNSIVHPEFS